jgi:hypothetical protein
MKEGAGYEKTPPQYLVWTFAIEKSIVRFTKNLTRFGYLGLTKLQKKGQLFFNS